MIWSKLFFLHFHLEWGFVPCVFVINISPSIRRSQFPYHTAHISRCCLALSCTLHSGYSQQSERPNNLNMRIKNDPEFQIGRYQSRGTCFDIIPTEALVEVCMSKHIAKQIGRLISSDHKQREKGHSPMAKDPTPTEKTKSNVITQKCHFDYTTVGHSGFFFWRNFDVKTHFRILLALKLFFEA